MLAVAPHAAIVGFEPLTLENVRNQVRLVLKTAAKLVAVGRLEVMLKAEVAEDTLRVDKGFRRAQEEARSRGALFGERLLHAVIDESFEKTRGPVPAAIVLEGLLGIPFAF